MGERHEVRLGYEDWDKIVVAKEESLKVIDANKRNIEVGEIVEDLVLQRALMERDKYPKPVTETMDEENKQDETPDKPEEDEKPEEPEN